jgi:hypothetical protein
MERFGFSLFSGVFDRSIFPETTWVDAQYAASVIASGDCVDNSCESCVFPTNGTARHFERRRISRMYTTLGYETL